MTTEGQTCMTKLIVDFEILLTRLKNLQIKMLLSTPWRHVVGVEV